MTHGDQFYKYNAMKFFLLQIHLKENVYIIIIIIMSSNRCIVLPKCYYETFHKSE